MQRNKHKDAYVLREQISFHPCVNMCETLGYVWRGTRQIATWKIIEPWWNEHMDDRCTELLTIFKRIINVKQVWALIFRLSKPMHRRVDRLK